MANLEAEAELTTLAVRFTRWPYSEFTTHSAIEIGSLVMPTDHFASFILDKMAQLLVKLATSP